MLAVIRYISIFIYFILGNLALFLVCLVRPFHRNNVFLAGKVYSFMARMAGLKLVFRVPDSVKNGGPYVFICNHQNSYDLITVCGAAQKGMVTVGKKSLVWIPVFGQLYWLTGNIIIDRKNSGKAADTLKYAADQIKKRGLSVWFFPEGTRSYGRGLLPFKTGAFRIAKSTDEAVVTVSASSLHNKIKLNRWDNGTLLVELSDPEPMPENMDVKKAAVHFHAKMQANIERLDQEVAESAKAR